MNSNTDGELRRKRIFDKYSDNLHLLVKNGVLSLTLKYSKTYICPICKEQFSENALDQNSSNPLTLEDAPPKSLGGKADILTCKECNNKLGRQVDFHLAERMNELDRQERRPGIEFDAHFVKDGVRLQGRVKVDLDGSIKITHHGINNNPQTLQTHIASTKGGDGIYIEYKKSRVDPKKMQLALLKTSYLLTFQKFGYAFILDPVYDRVRMQLRNPDAAIYPLEFWFTVPFPKDMFGVPFITEKGLESIFPTFQLKTAFSERVFSAVVPLTTIPIEDIIAELQNRQGDGSFEMAMALLNADYLTDLTEVHTLLKWISESRQ